MEPSHSTDESSDHQTNDETATTDELSTSDWDHSLQLAELEVHAGGRCLIKNVDATFPDAKITVVVGGSGAGKSVLLRILAGLLPRNGEAIQWSGNVTCGADGAKRPRVGIVFQQFALFDELSPKANVQFALDHRPRSARASNKMRPANDPNNWDADRWIRYLGVPERTPVSALSGGQKQRLAIARTLASSPDVLLYDEPTSGLDAASGTLVANLIRETQTVYGRTSIVVTHDYEILMPIADKVLLLDPVKQALVEVDPEHWDDIPKRMVPVTTMDDDEDDSELKQPKRSLVGQWFDQVFEVTGGAIAAIFWLPLDLLPIVPRPRWAVRFSAHFLRLVAGPSAWAYLLIAGLIVGFTSTYFTFQFLPFRLYTQPLLIDELLASIGFALYRILVPILATILIAARSGAAVAADVGVKQYGGQVDALRTLGVAPRAYLLLPIVVAFVIGTPILEAMAFYTAKFISMVAFSALYADIGPFYWEQHFHQRLLVGGELLFDGWYWVQLKNFVCGLGTATIAYYQGLAPKRSASDVSHSITSTVLWATLFVLTVHFVVALLEF